jgi:hypothetical protein
MSAPAGVVRHSLSSMTRTLLASLALLTLTAPAWPAAPRKPPPYSLPFQLRPVVATNVVRSDTSLAFYEAPTGESGTTVVATLLGSAVIADGVAPLARLAFVSSSPPSGEPASALVNPALGVLYAFKPAASVRAAAFLGVTVPVGMGGGNGADPARLAAAQSGAPARAAMDNALFAVNDLTVFPGLGAAWVDGGFTLQAEVTLLQLLRVRGDDVQADERKTNLTSGAHAGWFALPALSLGVELRHQRWLSTPGAVERDGALRDTTTVAGGPRLHLDLGGGRWLRPGIAYAAPLDDPLRRQSYHIVQLDVPLVF